MSGNGNGNGKDGGSLSAGDTGPSRRVRVDPSRPRPAAAGVDVPPGEGVSGRLVVTVLVLGTLVLWGSLNIAFRVWRQGYRQRAEFGRERVVKVVEPLEAVIPRDEADPAARAAAAGGLAALGAAARPYDVRPEAWRAAVVETQAMLTTLTAANLLSQTQLAALGDQIRTRVADSTAHPEHAREHLALIWDDAQRSAGPIIDRRHTRPSFLRPFAPPPRRSRP